MSIPGVFDQPIPATFVQYAADVLADTAKGLSGPTIVRTTAAYAVEYDVDLPHPTYPFGAFNKRTALRKPDGILAKATVSNHQGTLRPFFIPAETKC